MPVCGMKDCENTLRPGEAAVCAPCMGKIEQKNGSTSKRPMSDKVAAVGAYAADFRRNNSIPLSTGDRRYNQLQQVKTNKDRRSEVNQFIKKKRLAGSVPAAKAAPFVNSNDPSHQSSCQVAFGYHINFNDTIVSPYPLRRGTVMVDTAAKDDNLEYTLIEKARMEWPAKISSESTFADWPTPNKPQVDKRYYYLAKLSGPVNKREFLTYPAAEVSTMLAMDIQRHRPTKANPLINLELIYNADKWFDEHPHLVRPETDLSSTKSKSPSKAPSGSRKGSKRKAADSITPSEAGLDDDQPPSSKRTKTYVPVPATPQMQSAMLPPPPPPKRRPQPKKDKSPDIQIVAGPSTGTSKKTLVISNGFHIPEPLENSASSSTLETVVVPGTLHREFNSPHLFLCYTDVFIMTMSRPCIGCRFGL